MSTPSQNTANDTLFTAGASRYTGADIALLLRATRCLYKHHAARLKHLAETTQQPAEGEQLEDLQVITELGLKLQKSLSSMQPAKIAAD